jgi:hypothetical protein
VRDARARQQDDGDPWPRSDTRERHESRPGWPVVVGRMERFPAAEALFAMNTWYRIYSKACR